MENITVEGHPGPSNPQQSVAVSVSLICCNCICSPIHRLVPEPVHPFYTNCIDPVQSCADWGLTPSFTDWTGKCNWLTEPHHH